MSPPGRNEDLDRTWKCMESHWADIKSTPLLKEEMANTIIASLLLYNSRLRQMITHSELTEFERIVNKVIRTLSIQFNPGHVPGKRISDSIKKVTRF
jgi:hypothetical protein